MKNLFCITHTDQFIFHIATLTTIVTSLEKNTSYIWIVVEGTPSRQKSGVVKTSNLKALFCWRIHDDYLQSLAELQNAKHNM
jgi:hypothetical protein